MSAMPDKGEMCGQVTTISDATCAPVILSDGNECPVQSDEALETPKRNWRDANPQCQLLMCLGNDDFECAEACDGDCAESGGVSDLSDEEDIEVLKFLAQQVVGDGADACAADPETWQNDHTMEVERSQSDGDAEYERRQNGRVADTAVPQDDRATGPARCPDDFAPEQKPAAVSSAPSRKRQHERISAPSKRPPDRRPKHRDRSSGRVRDSRQEGYRAHSTVQRDASRLLRHAFSRRHDPTLEDMREARERARNRERDRDRERERDRDRDRDRDRKREREKDAEQARRDYVKTRDVNDTRREERRSRLEDVHIKRKVDLRPRDLGDALVADSRGSKREGAVREYWSGEKLDNREDSRYKDLEHVEKAYKHKHRHRDAWDLRFENIPQDMDWAELRELGREYSESVFYATVLHDRGMSIGILKFRHKDEAYRVLDELDGRKIEGCRVPLKIILSESKKAST